MGEVQGEEGKIVDGSAERPAPLSRGVRKLGSDDHSYR